MAKTEAADDLPTDDWNRRSGGGESPGLEGNHNAALKRTDDEHADSQKDSSSERRMNSKLTATCSDREERDSAGHDHDGYAHHGTDRRIYGCRAVEVRADAASGLAADERDFNQEAPTDNK